jgi:hypothetical protein
LEALFNIGYPFDLKHASATKPILVWIMKKAVLTLKKEALKLAENF